MVAGDYSMFFVAGVLAASINAVAGGGPILTLGILSFLGVDPRIANLTSTVALCPGQLLAGHAARSELKVAKLGKPAVLIALSACGGALGAVLLLLTSGDTFKVIVPWLVFAATAIYGWSGFRQNLCAAPTGQMRQRLLTASYVPMTVYGGYFGGGNSFLVLALLELSGQDPREAGSIKNALVAAINLGAVVVFSVSDLVDWRVAAVLGTGGIIGSFVGMRLLRWLPVAWVRLIVIVFGFCFSGWMFFK